MQSGNSGELQRNHGNQVYNNHVTHIFYNNHVQYNLYLPGGKGRKPGKSRDTVNRGSVERGSTILRNIGGREEGPVNRGSR